MNTSDLIPLILGALVRQAKTVAGTYLVGHGYATDSGVEEITGAVLVLISAGWSVWQKIRASRSAASPPSDPPAPGATGGTGGRTASGTSTTAAALGLMISALAILAFGSGCARFRTVQSDRNAWTDTNGVPHIREITTRATATAVMAGKGSLDGWKANQTDKSQGASLSKMNGESDATALTEAIGAILVRGLAAGMNPAALAVPSAAPTAAPAAKGLAGAITTATNPLVIPAAK